MTTKHTTAVGVFEDSDEAQRAIETLQQSGFEAHQIGFAGHGSEDVVEETAEGAAGGAVTGGIVGGVLGAVAAGLIPGIGPVLGAGILAATIGGAATGAAAGSLIGALTAAGVSEEDALYYEGEFKSGKTLVAVNADGRYLEATSTLRRLGAYGIDDPETIQEMEGTDDPDKPKRDKDEWE